MIYGFLGRVFGCLEGCQPEGSDERTADTGLPPWRRREPEWVSLFTSFSGWVGVQLSPENLALPRVKPGLAFDCRWQDRVGGAGRERSGMAGAAAWRCQRRGVVWARGAMPDLRWCVGGDGRVCQCLRGNAKRSPRARAGELGRWSAGTRRRPGELPARRDASETGLRKPGRAGCGAAVVWPNRLGIHTRFSKPMQTPIGQ